MGSHTPSSGEFISICEGGCCYMLCKELTLSVDSPHITMKRIENNYIIQSYINIDM